MTIIGSHQLQSSVGLPGTMNQNLPFSHEVPRAVALVIKFLESYSCLAPHRKEPRKSTAGLKRDRSSENGQNNFPNNANKLSKLCETSTVHAHSPHLPLICWEEGGSLGSAACSTLGSILMEVLCCGCHSVTDCTFQAVPQLLLHESKV